jgi:probable F420-dependent oxidoreductase
MSAPRLNTVMSLSDMGGDPQTIKQFAQAAEALGYDGLAVADHVIGANVENRPNWGDWNTSKDLFHDPFVLFGFLSACTTRLEFSTQVLILAQRQTALVAKQAADIDLFSDGRLRLGVGVGWNWVEFDALEVGPYFRRRGKREEDQIALLRKLWTQALVTHNDHDHHVERAGLLPLPKRSIPIWLGGFSKPAFDRAARIADGFLFSGRSQDEAVQIKADMERKLREHGRENEPFGFEQIQQYSRGPDAWPQDIGAWQDAGGSHISVVTMNAGLQGIDAHIDAIRQWREAFEAT